MLKKPVKIRKTWKINPATRVAKSKKLYSRQKEKLAAKRTIEDDPFGCAQGHPERLKGVEG